MLWDGIYNTSSFNLLDAMSNNGFNLKYFDWDNVVYIVWRKDKTSILKVKIFKFVLLYLRESIWSIFD